MKKFSEILLLAFILSSSLLNAREKSDSLQNKVNKWSIGILGGATITNSYIKDYSYSNPWTYDKRTHHNVGINFVRMFNKNAISIGAFYTELGYRESDRYISTQISTFFFREITFPVLYEREIGNRELIKFVVGGGVMAGRLFFSSKSGANFHETFSGKEPFMFSGTLNAGIKIIPFENKIPFILRGNMLEILSEMSTRSEERHTSQISLQ